MHNEDLEALRLVQMGEELGIKFEEEVKGNCLEMC